MVGAIAATACQTSHSPVRLEERLDLISAQAERDSLFQELAQSSQAITDIATELAKVAPAGGPTAESPDLRTTLNDREYVVSRVRDVTARLKDTEARLATSERRAARLVRQRDTLAGNLGLAQSVILDLQRTLAGQKEALAGLAAQLDEVSAASEVLADSVTRLADQRNTAYYVIGTREELVARGVLVADGRRSVPLVGRRDVQPARELPLGEFTSIDRSRISEIPLPDTSRTYRIVSRQNLAHLDGDHRKGRVQGSIRITSAEGFWEPGRYLIVVAQ
jgi:hypothetical protein